MINLRATLASIASFSRIDRIMDRFPILYPLSAKFQRCILWTIPLVLLIVFFYSAFNANARFAYRDVAHYYYPLFQQIQNEWEQGRLPLWNPYENLGQPLAGNPSSSVFYPVKALFFLSTFRLLSYSCCFKLYIWFHVVLAFVSLYLLARRLEISRSGATLAGISYAFSGQVLFQYSNVIYLVGAAWAPLLFLCARDYFVARELQAKIPAILKLSVAEAFVILGGEPQIAYLSLIISTIIFLCSSKRTNDSPKIVSSKTTRLFEALKFLVAVSIIAFLLTAIQILPSMEFVNRSSRASESQPRSIWNVPQALFSTNDNVPSQEAPNAKRPFYTNMLCQDFSTDGRSRSIYRFSAGPWRWLEFLFPNIGGRQFPQSSRWFLIFPEEYAVWTPTLYFGVVPFLLALASFKFVVRPQLIPDAQLKRAYWQKATTYLVIFALLASLGGFGFVWFIRTIKALIAGGSIPTNFTDGDPVGGIYWLLTLIVPLFASFRYPAKLLVLASIGFSILSGFGWDDVRLRRRFTRIAIGVATLSSVLLLFFFIYPNNIFSSVKTVDPVYGPFQPQLALTEVRRSLLQTTLVILASIALISLQNRWKDKKRGQFKRIILPFLSFILISITASDLYFANAWTIPVEPASLFAKKTEILTQIESNYQERLKKTRAQLPFEKNLPSPYRAYPPARIYRYSVWFPPTFQQESSPNRSAERVLWDGLTFFPKYSWENNLAAIDERGTAIEYHYNAFLDSLIARQNADAELAFLDVEQIVGPRGWVERISPSSPANKNEPDAGSASAEHSQDWALTFKRPNNVPSRAGLFREGVRVDICASPNDSQKLSDSVEIVAFEPNKITYLVLASAPSELIMAEQSWSDWQIESTPISAEEKEKIRAVSFDAKRIDACVQALRRKSETSSLPSDVAFGFMRKTSVPSGLFCIVCKYRPRLLFIGAGVSGIAWTLLLIVVLRRLTKFFRRRAS